MADNFYSKYSANEPATVVTSLNGLNGAVTLVAGSNITLTPSGNSITIAGAAAGANTALSNLASVAVNTSLLPASDIAIDLGSTSLRWRSVFTDAVRNAVGSNIVDVSNQILKDSNGTSTVFFGSKYLQDGGGHVSVDWNGRTLNASNGVPTAGWASGSLVLPTSNPLVFQDNTAANSVTVRAPTLVNTSYTLTLPSDQGAANTYLKNNGSGTLTWAAASSGSVTSVAMTVPSFLSVSGSPITTSGTLAVSLSGTALPILNGGTGQTTANDAINALLPTQTSNSGKFLTTDGTNTSWGTPAGGGSVVALNAINNNSQIISSGTWTAISYNSHVIDTNTAYSGANYTIPITGYYKVSASIFTASATPATTDEIAIRVTQNGTNVAYGEAIGNGASHPIFAATPEVIISATAGDVLQVLVYSTGPSLTLSSSQPVGSTFAVIKL